MSGGVLSLARIQPPVRSSTAAWTALGLAAVATALSAPSPAIAGVGGAYSMPRPLIRTVTCVSGCVGVRTAKAGSVVRVRGSRLDQVRYVAFLGGRGRRDNVVVPARSVAARSVEAQVPARARTGAVRVINADGNRSAGNRAQLQVAVVNTPIRGIGPIMARVDTRRVFYDGPRRATLTYMARSTRPAVITIELVRARDGASIMRWGPLTAAPGVVQTVEWDGTAAGRVQGAGRYEFRIAVVTPGTGAQAANNAGAVDKFAFLPHRFPVRGAHDFGSDIARFGAPRDGHSHEGHDVFAACGTPLVAARGGVVRTRAFHFRAGNYVVIDGAGTGIDYAYMHLREPALVADGERVYTGQVIGFVGETGVASGCHLHFEMWSAPGWQTGGSPMDPLPNLIAWDAVS